MSLLFQQQQLRGEKPTDSRCLYWGLDDSLFVLYDNHFYQWRLTPCQSAMWAKDFAYVLTKSTANKDLNRTFAQILSNKHPHLAADVKLLSELAAFGHNNFNSAAVGFKLNSFTLDPVIIQLTLQPGSSSDSASDPYTLLRATKSSDVQLVTAQTTQGNICVYHWKRSEWKLRQNLCAELMNYSIQQRNDDKMAEEFEDVRLDEDIEDVTAELNFLRCVSHEWTAEPSGSGTAMLLSLQRDGRIVVWRYDQSSNQLEVSQVILAGSQHLPTAFSLKFIDDSTGLLVVGYANGLINGHSVAYRPDGQLSVGATLELYTDADDLSCSACLISPLEQSSAVVCSKNQHLMIWSVTYDSVKQNWVKSKSVAIHSGLQTRILELICRSDVLYVVDSCGYKVFRLNIDAKRTVSLSPIAEDVQPNFSPSPKNSKTCGLAISPNNLMAVVFIRSAWVNVRRNCVLSLDFRLNLTEEQLFWSVQRPPLELVKLTDFLVISRRLLLTEKAQLERKFLDELIGTADGSPSLTTLSTAQLKLTRVFCEFISLIRSNRDSDFNRRLTNTQLQIDLILAARHIRAILSDAQLRTELESTADWTDKHSASLASVAQLIKWYPETEKEKIPEGNMWNQLLQAKHNEMSLKLASCPVCQAVESQLQPFDLRQFNCSNGHNVPRCCLTFLPIGADDVTVLQCVYCGTFALQSDCLLGILSQFHACLICGSQVFLEVS